MPTKRKRNHKRNPHKGVTVSTHKKIFIFIGGTMAILFGVLLFRTASKPAYCANSISCIKDLSGKYEQDASKGTYLGRELKVPSQKVLSYVNPGKSVLGESTGSKKIAVDLSNQHLYAYEGDKVVMDFPVSTGKWHHTPTGIFHIWVKLAYTRMSGGSGADYYNLPNVPYTMFFSNSEVGRGEGYSIHGAYWHNNFGHPMSHGCVNMRIADAGQLFAWADPQTTGWQNQATDSNPGTEVVIYGETPQE